MSAKLASRDRLTKAQRSWNMSRIRSTNTKPEIVVRRLLTGMGLRYRLHRAGLPGKPDIVLGPRRLVIFVHGCFWHRHPGCKQATMPSANRAFWLAKLEGNAARDQRHRRALRHLGWRVVTVWECETREPGRLARRLARAAGSGAGTAMPGARQVQRPKH
jgi:DNA mismatch endonuclease (patch repair protein)